MYSYLFDFNLADSTLYLGCKSNLSKITFAEYNGTKDLKEGPEIKELADLLYSTNQIFYKKLNEVYQSIHPTMSACSFNSIIFCIQQLDTLNTKCEVANLYNYSKPTIKMNDNSFVSIKELRHVLIEHLEKNELYVSNDIDLGIEEQGILLF